MLNANDIQHYLCKAFLCRFYDRVFQFCPCLREVPSVTKLYRTLRITARVIIVFIWDCEDRKGVIPKVIGTGIVLVSVASGVLLFDRLRIYDIIIDGFLVYFIFFAKTCRQLPRNENREDIS